MEKKAKTILIISALALAQLSLFDFANANPWLTHELDSSPPVNAKISIISPKNCTAYSSGLPLSFDISFVNSTNVFVYIRNIYYKASWETENKTVYTWNYYDEHNLNPYDDDPKISEFSYEQSFTNIPEGKQNITITVSARGSYAIGLNAYFFSINESATVDFTVDATSLTIAEPVQDPAPSPSQEPISSSEPKNVEAFPIVPVATASVAVVLVVGTGTLVYFKKRER